MLNRMLHVFRNTPFGRETLLQSAYFCRQAGLDLVTYIPQKPQFLLYFPNKIVTVDLDRAFLRSPESAREHVERLVEPFEIDVTYLKPERFTAGTLPEIPTDYDYVCCPRVIGDLSTKVRLGHIGPRVRSIIRNAAFPSLLPAAVYKEWKSIVCFFGGSENSQHALSCSQRIACASGKPLEVFTQAEKHSQDHYRHLLERAGFADESAGVQGDWRFFDGGSFKENLYAVPHDALVVVGAYGHGLAVDLVFGSKMEMIQSTLPNPMLIVGPGYSVSPG